MKRLAILALLALPACTDSYGNVDPLRTGLLGAGIGGGAGLLGGAIAQGQQTPKYYGAGPYGGYAAPYTGYAPPSYYRPAPAYGGGYNAPPFGWRPEPHYGVYGPRPYRGGW